MINIIIINITHKEKFEISSLITIIILIIFIENKLHCLFYENVYDSSLYN